MKINSFFNFSTKVMKFIIRLNLNNNISIEYQLVNTKYTTI